MATTTAPPEPAAPADIPPPSLRQRLLSGSTLGPLAALIIACAFFSLRTALGNTFTLGDTDITYGSIVTIGLFLLFAYLLGQTAWGRHVYAVGNNPEAARLTGIPTNRVLVGVYATAGLVYGIAALLS